MSLNVGAAMDQVRQEAADRLLRAAVFFQTQHQARVGVSNPRPYLNSSKVGEYPRKRTGGGQAGVVYGPEMPAEVAQALKVRLGLLPSAAHLAILEFGRERLGFIKTAADLEGQVQTILS